MWEALVTVWSNVLAYKSHCFSPPGFEFHSGPILVWEGCTVDLLKDNSFLWILQISPTSQIGRFNISEKNLDLDIQSYYNTPHIDLKDFYHVKQKNLSLYPCKIFFILHMCKDKVYTLWHHSVTFTPVSIIEVHVII